MSDEYVYAHEMICAEAGCKHPAIYDMDGELAEGWCANCRAYYQEHDLWRLAVDQETIESVERRIQDPAYLQALAEYLERVRGTE